jgi:hypothetical protein
MIKYSFEKKNGHLRVMYVEERSERGLMELRGEEPRRTMLLLLHGIVF